MKEESIEFKHWKTGEIIRYNLSFSHPSENKTNLICPLDQTMILFVYDGLSKNYICPNCELNYSIPFTNQELVNKYFQKHISDLKKELSNMNSRKKDITLFIKKAENSLKENKANLSEQKFSNTL